MIDRAVRAAFPIAGTIAAVGLVIGACSPSDTASTPSTTVPVVSTSTTQPVTTTTTATQETTTTTTTTTTTLPVDELVLKVQTVGTGFDNPVLLVADPHGGPDFVVEQTGSIVRHDDSGHALALDLRDEVDFGGEKGLLGLAFHPDFEENHLAYVSYITPGPNTVIEQFEVVEGVFTISSRTTIMEFPQPAGNHNGGMIAFGPDGYLWIGLGDGGRSNDSLGHAQRSDTLYGSMLRIVVGVPGAEPYVVPSDNPYRDGDAGRAEVWAVGLRNPWRFAFDGNDIWIADVGQGSIEEVNLADASEPGLNYGWSIMEGSSCFRSSSCDAEGLVLPIAEYTHDDGCSVTGGVVYRGDAIPSLRGQFFYADFCSGLLRSVDADARQFDWTDMVGPLPNPTGFGVGGDGEVYITTKTGDLLMITTEGT